MRDNKRAPLTRARVMAAALSLADESGIERLTIRRLAESLDVKPMTIYHYAAGKEDIIDGIVDLVFAEIELPPTDQDWQAAMRIRCLSARAVLARHPWAPPFMESRTSPGPASLRHHEAVLACLIDGGLPLPLTAHAYALLDSFVYGFALQEANLPFGGGEEIAGLASQILEAIPKDEYPAFARFTAEHVLTPGYSFGSSFEFGLDLILDGLAQASQRT